MSSTTKIVIAVVVVILVVLGIWYWSAGNHGSWNNGAASTSDAAMLPSGSDTSDAALDQDMASINANIQAADADSTNADQSVSAAAAGTDQ